MLVRTPNETDFVLSSTQNLLNKRRNFMILHLRWNSELHWTLHITLTVIILPIDIRWSECITLYRTSFFGRISCDNVCENNFTTTKLFFLFFYVFIKHTTFVLSFRNSTQSCIYVNYAAKQNHVKNRLNLKI